MLALLFKILAITGIGVDLSEVFLWNGVMDLAW